MKQQLRGDTVPQINLHRLNAPQIHDFHITVDKKIHTCLKRA